jgi:hypothetical protein
MAIPQIYILISIVAFLIIFFVVVFVRKDKRGKRLAPLARFSLLFVLAGIIFIENRLIGYILISLGILLAILDISLKLKKK